MNRWWLTIVRYKATAHFKPLFSQVTCNCNNLNWKIPAIGQAHFHVNQAIPSCIAVSTSPPGRKNQLQFGAIVQISMLESRPRTNKTNIAQSSTSRNDCQLWSRVDRPALEHRRSTCALNCETYSCLDTSVSCSYTREFSFSETIEKTLLRIGGGTGGGGGTCKIFSHLDLLCWNIRFTCFEKTNTPSAMFVKWKLRMRDIKE